MKKKKILSSTMTKRGKVRLGGLNIKELEELLKRAPRARDKQKIRNRISQRLS